MTEILRQFSGSIEFWGCVITGILLLQTFLQRKGVPKVRIPPPKLDFSKDMETLMFLIDVKISTKVQYTAKSKLDQKKTGFLRDDVIEKMSIEIVQELMEEMSNIYIATLSRYFRGREGIIVFASNVVYTAVMVKVLGLNDVKFADMDRQARFKQIARANRAKVKEEN